MSTWYTRAQHWCFVQTVWITLASLHSVSISKSRGVAGLQQDLRGQDLRNSFEVHTFAETTAVQFGKLSDQEIAAYIATGR